MSIIWGAEKNQRVDHLSECLFLLGKGCPGGSEASGVEIPQRYRRERWGATVTQWKLPFLRWSRLKRIQSP
jgi:hypothetical protein